MKQYILRKPEQRPEAKPRKLLKAKAPGKAPTQLAEIIKIGVDVGLNKYAYSRQVDGSGQEPPHLCSPEEFREYAVAQKGWVKRVVVCYEAGLFGFQLSRDQTQAQSLEGPKGGATSAQEGDCRGRSGVGRGFVAFGHWTDHGRKLGFCGV